MNPSPTLQARAEALATERFTGGVPTHFEAAGRLQLITLLRCGLYPHSRVLDIGCGMLRGGYWLLHFLDRGCYFGIEPNEEMLAMADRLLEPGLREAKAPRFDHNTRFDASVFGTTFDFMVARSVWTHAPKHQIETMLDTFAAHAEREGLMLASYLPAGRGRPDYDGTEWVGRSHESDEPGIVYHRLDWVRDAAAARGLEARELDVDIVNEQVWIAVQRAGVARPSDRYLGTLLDPHRDAAARRPLYRARALLKAALGRGGR